MDNSFLFKLGIQSQEIIAGIGRVNSSLTTLHTSFKNLGTTLAAGLGFTTLASGLTNSIKSIAEFSHEMQKIKAVTGATGADFEQLKDNALNMAGAFKAIDIAKMELELGRLGFTTQEIINTTKASVNLATATGEDLGRSAEILGSTLRAFNLDASESGRVADVMAVGFNNSALALSDFSEAIKYVAPVAAAAGISIEQTSALLGVLADNGIKGSMAGTSLRKIISDLGQGAAPVLNQKLKEMAAAGISGAQAMDEVGRTAYASLLILSNNTDKIEANTKAAMQNKGTLEEMARVMQDDLLGDWNKMNAEWDKSIQKGGAFAEGLRVIVQGFTSWLSAMNALDAKMTDFYKRLAVFAAGGGMLAPGTFIPKTPSPTIGGGTKAATKNAQSIGGGLPLKEEELNSVTRGLTGVTEQSDKLFKVWGQTDISDAFVQKLFGVGEVSTGLQHTMFGLSEANAGVTSTLAGMALASELSGTALIKFQTTAEALAEATEGISNKMRRSWIQIAMTVSDVVSETLSGNQSLSDSMRQMASNVIRQLEALTLAYILEHEAKKFGLLGLLGVAAGFGVVRSLFAGIRSGARGGSASVSPSVYRSSHSRGATDENALVASYTISGRDLEVVLKRNGLQNSFSKFG